MSATRERPCASLDATEDNVSTAFAILDEQATDDQRAQYAETAGVELAEVDAEADAALLGGYAFTAADDSPVVAVLAVGGPDIRLMADGQCYVLVGTLGGMHLERYSPILNRWGAHIAEATRCACPDDRCAGFHHDADLDYCPCAESLAQDGAR